ncbi:cobyrinate a,c-diamide synthase [Nitrosomonas marina]|uniref:Hydrogenobyrinic acid a,c-diamide synthase (Glutamine-hydrolysing) /cobyrinate a,c-diamide synthase n=1 Tax=Nitrosomonas marina TaxID=917 RepID=A0A1H8IPC8_9PROT|nr:cobyrinate a,c-diamide synthase [Nitrosomonas marina]SEN70269.1 hydrogenobyrinic acid a,c-diamide synthase (glutamine-hydrolysing) /cobyrinate a,c-diamide synthase [Nitrosomonas marina]
MKHCPALLVSAPASGQGKTTITAALARLHRNQGRRVHVFKIGPDFLDPMILEQASGNPVYQLDLWMGGKAHCQQLLYQAASRADLILIEGVMGLFDGEPSSADIAAAFGIPVLAVIDATAMAQTFGAVAHGLATYRPDLHFAGILANRVASKSHAEMLQESLSPDLPWFGAIFSEQNSLIPSRHLGLVQADEVDDIDRRLDKFARQFSEETALNTLPQAVAFSAPGVALNALPHTLKNVRIAVASDNAFSFIYRANLNLLQAMGAKLMAFSPLNDRVLPDADSLYLPGGYPELHLEKLATNQTMREAIRDHHAAGKAIVAECGGMLYLLTTLTDSSGQQGNMMDILPGKATMQNRLVNLGLHSGTFPNGELRGHTFHYSKLETSLESSSLTQPTRKSLKPEPIFQDGKLTASYIHWYFPSNPAVVAALFQP